MLKKEYNKMEKFFRPVLTGRGSFHILNIKKEKKKPHYSIIQSLH